MSQGRSERKLKTIAFHERPLCTIAVGWLFGTALLRYFAPPAAYVGSAVFFVVSLAARWTNRRGWALLLLAAGLALASAAFRYPPGGVFPITGPVFAPNGSLILRLSTVRAAIGERIDILFPDNSDLMQGLLLGEKGSISNTLLDTFKRVGIMHIFAVSGLHVSVLAAAFSLLFRRNAWVRFGCTALFLCAYAALTAFSPSVMRASLMLLCYMLAFPLHRRPDALNALALSFIIILLLNPLALFFPGFQLSYGAIYGLILLGPTLSNALRKLGSAASTAIGSSVAVMIATIPAMATAFTRVQPLSVLTNLLVLPIVPFALIPAFVGTALSYLSMPLGNAIASVARVALDCIVAVASVGGQFDVPVTAPYAASYLLFLGALPFLSPLCLLERYEKLRNACVLLALSVVLWVAI